MINHGQNLSRFLSLLCVLFLAYEKQLTFLNNLLEQLFTKDNF